MHFEIRKHLLEYDNVMNQQRNVIYSLRRDILMGNDIEEILKENIENVLDTIFSEYVSNLDIADEEGLRKKIAEIFAIDYSFIGINRKNIEEYKEGVKSKIFEKLQDKKNELGEHFVGFSRFLMMNILDSKWKEHLLNMDHLRDSVGLRGYGQKDPLIEYKRESYKLFVDMINKINFETVNFLFHVHVKVESREEIALKEKQTKLREERKDIFGDSQDDEVKRTPIKREMPKVGRNDPCPCGSGKKYKKCCGASDSSIA
jgi:preprotein translocase subunit SecA